MNRTFSDNAVAIFRDRGYEDAFHGREGAWRAAAEKAGPEELGAYRAGVRIGRRERARTRRTA